MLQALFVQQDALRHLIGIVRPTAPLEFSDVLKDGRETRNASVGHPTKFERKGLTSVHSMSRSTLGRDGFLMASFEEKNDTFFQHVPIGELIVKQREEAVRLLSKVVTQLKEADELHRKQFRTVILRNSFSQVLYAFEKISDEVRRSSPPGMGPWAGEQLQNSQGEFERLLKERGLDVETYDPVKYLYNEIQFPLAQLRAFLVGESSEMMSREAARVFASALAGYFSELMDIAREIDEEYSSIKDDRADPATESSVK